MIHPYDPKDLDSLPLHLRLYGASDYATMEARKGKKEPDFTEHGVAGMDFQGHLWFVDWWSGQKQTDKSIQAFTNLLRKYKALDTPVIRWWNEGGLIDKAISPAVNRAMAEANCFVTVEHKTSIMDKGAKLQAFHARCTAGTVHFPINTPWADRVIEQLIKFPAGRWDDAADVCGLLGRGVDEMVAASVPSVERKPDLVPFTAAWIEFDSKLDKPKERYF